MPERTLGQGSDRVSPLLSREFVAVPRDDEKVLYILADDFTVIPPDWSDGVEKQGQCIETDVPELLVLVPVALLKRDDLRNLLAMSFAPANANVRSAYLRIN